MPTAIFDRFDVVVVAFPFTDKAARKRRPALVLSSAKTFNREIGHSVMTMITSAENPEWPLDTPIGDLAAAGLSSPSVIRMKLFTLDRRFVLRKAGQLTEDDQRRFQAMFGQSVCIKRNRAFADLEK
jgi:mRNA interferase MazF